MGVVSFRTYFFVAQPMVNGRLPATSTAKTEYRFIDGLPSAQAKLGHGPDYYEASEMP
jgi:hypothetical protein